jgi:hypothetical protein
MLDPKEEAKFDELKVKCRELKVLAPPEIMIGLQVHEGGVLTFDDVQRGHSWTRNFYNSQLHNTFKVGYTSTSLFEAGHISHRRTNGNISDTQYTLPISNSLPILEWLKPGVVGDATYGVLAGTSDTAWGGSDYAITDGGLSYQRQDDVVAAYTPATKTWTITISRIMNNNTGSSVTIKEVGMVAVNATYGYVHLFERSVLSPTVAVANGAQLTVTYEISIDFSAID